MPRSKANRRPVAKASKENKKMVRAESVRVEKTKSADLAPRLDRAIKLLAIGDAVLEPPLYRRNDQGTPVAAYRGNSPLTWLRTILPQAELDDTSIFAVPGSTTAATAELVDKLPDISGGFDAVLVSIGLQDCFQTILGIAPSPEQTVASIEQIVNAAVSAQTRPILIVPPPCPQFSNGLFADRYLAISATLRRIARQRREVILVDATDRLKDPDAFGIEPAPDMASGDDHGRLSTKGATVLAEAIAEAVIEAFGLDRSAYAGVALADDALNENPLLRGTKGSLNGAFAIGKVPDGYVLNSEHSGGIRAFSGTGNTSGRPQSCRLSAHGRYNSNYPFIRLDHPLAQERFSVIEPGDHIEALAEFTLGENRGSLAAIQLQLAPAWSKGFIGLRSVEFTGDLLIGESDHGVIRTPPFAIPAPLEKLFVSLVLFFKPGTDLEADAMIDVHSLVVRKVVTEH